MTENKVNILISQHFRKDVVKIKFNPASNRIRKTMRLWLSIGSDIVERQLGWKDKDYVHVKAIEDRFIIEKIDKKEKKGHIIAKIKNSNSYRIILTCNYIDGEDFKIRIVDHEVVEENQDKLLNVYFNGKSYK